MIGDLRIRPFRSTLPHYLFVSLIFCAVAYKSAASPIAISVVAVVVCDIKAPYSFIIINLYG